MISILTKLWNDESGYVLSAELVLVGTLGVIGATVGLKMAADAVNEELTEVAVAFRSLDQSYSVPGFRCCGAWTASSEYQQPDVEKSVGVLKLQAEQHAVELQETLKRLEVEDEKHAAE